MNTQNPTQLEKSKIYWRMNRVSRGGFWIQYPLSIRIWYRYENTPSIRYGLGFRLVRNK